MGATRGPWPRLGKKNVDPIIVEQTHKWWADLPMVLCMGFAHGFGHDGFLLMASCRSGQGNYDYVLI